MSTFGDNLKKARLAKGITQQELAKAAEVKQEAISQYENGARIPTPEIIKKIAKKIEVDVKDLTEEKGNDFGKTILMRKIKGLSGNSLEQLSNYADYLKSQQK